jgi:small-conductance mechanosensitive channel/CRP-like cAMP-binding protein
LEAWFDQARSRYTIWILLASIVFVALLVNRFQPTRRHKLRRLVILFVLALACELISSICHATGAIAWHDRLEFASSLLEVFIAINVAVTLLFDIITPAISVQVPVIASDLVIGVAYLVATFGALHAAGVNPSSVLGASAVVSAVLALSLQSTLGNVIGGVALQLDGSVRTGDWIQLENGRQGKVKEIRWRHTVMETRDWGTLIVPNASLLQSQILILGKREGQPKQHRYWVYFNVDFRYAPTRVIDVVNAALQDGTLPNVSHDPKPHCLCLDFAKDGRDSFGYYAARYWLTDLAVDDPTNSLVRQRIYMALKRANIPLARPVSTTFVAPEEDDGARRLRHRGRRLSALKGMELFKSLTDQEREHLADHLIFAPFGKGELVTHKGNVAHWLYILFSGSVDIQITEGHETRVLTSIHAPGFFGEMGMMTGEPRAADVVAKTDAQCYRLDKEGFQEIMLARPELAKEMSKTMAERRAELVAAQDGLADEQKAKFAEEEEARILARIETFFGLSG